MFQLKSISEVVYSVGNRKRVKNFFCGHGGRNYKVIQEEPQETMFGLPFNLADEVRCKATMLSLDGTRETLFQLVGFEGVVGKNHANKALPRNRGFMSYRFEVNGIQSCYEDLNGKGVVVHRSLQDVEMAPYGQTKAFAVRSPDGVRITFFEK